jgi:DNA invertase Pin-like site-specific DNA recombinase
MQVFYVAAHVCRLQSLSSVQATNINSGENDGQFQKQETTKAAEVLSMSGAKKFVAINEDGRRIGSSHHNSSVSDETVDLIREMHEDRHMGYRKIAQELNICRHFVAKICRYERRAQTPAGWKKVDDKKNGQTP